MKNRIILAAVGLIALPLSVDTASASSSKPTLCERAWNVRVKVIHQHGKRAPGRNICRQGVRLSTGKVISSSVGQRARYLTQLRRLANVYMSPVPPRQPPGGAYSAAVAGAPPASVAQCESGGNPSTNTGNGFYGKWQFTLQTWQAMGGTGLPSNASEAEQDYRAARLWAGGAGRGNWPVCGYR
jgi:hypothetical protein